MINRRLQARPVSSLPSNLILRGGAGFGRSNLILDPGHKSGRLVVNKNLCAKAWTFLGAAVSLTALNVFIQSQGGLLFTGGYLIEKRPVIASFDAVFIVSAMLIVVCLAAGKHARLSMSDAWATRLPIIGDDGKDPVETRSWSLRCYQGFFLLVFVLVPAFSLLHFNDKVWNAGVVWKSDTPESAVNAIPVKCTITGAGGGCDGTKISKVLAPGKEGWLWLAETVHDPKEFQLKRNDNPSPILKSGFQDHDLSAECRKDSEACRGVQWFHPWNLIGMWAVTAIAFAAVGLLLYELFFRKGPQTAAPAL